MRDMGESECVCLFMSACLDMSKSNKKVSIYVCMYMYMFVLQVMICYRRVGEELKEE